MWNGKGFPPVGTVWKFLRIDTGDWVKGEFLGAAAGTCVMRPSNNRIDRVFVDMKSLRPIKTEWNGKGFPPVGTVCEFKYIGIWMKGEVVKSSPTSCMVENNTWGIYTENLHLLRPIKSAVEVGNEQAEWNGEGFPPAGIECETQYRNKWVQCHVIGMDDLGNCVARTDNEYTSSQLSEHFRPLRTERQIAQQEMAEIYKANSTASLVELFGLIHDAGYTK